MSVQVQSMEYLIMGYLTNYCRIGQQIYFSDKYSSCVYLLILRRARAQWLEERDASLQSRVDAAVSAAQKLWLEHHRAQLERRGVEAGQEATPTSRKDSGKSLRHW